MTRFCLAIAIVSLAAMAAAQPAAPTAPTAPAAPTATPGVQPAGAAQGNLGKTPGDFLPKTPRQPGPGGFYEQIPPSLEPAVRHIAEDNFSSATLLLLPKLDAAKDPKERAMIMMWLGIAAGQDALYYDVRGGWYGIATTSTHYLRQAVELDPDVFKAPDVARIMGEIVGAGWGAEDPEREIDRADKEDAKKRDPALLYYGGVVNRALTKRSWGMVDTSKEDNRSLGFFARSVVADPQRYETWTAYLDACDHLGMLDLLSSDTEKMYGYFKDMRTPLLMDQGPVARYVRTRFQWTREQAEEFLTKLAAEKPRDPFPRYELAQLALQTSPALAAERCADFVQRIDKGEIELLPKEQGYRISALYKQAFALMQAEKLDEALAVYGKVKAINPRYAEVDLNIATIYARKAELETNVTKKIELFEKAAAAAIVQKKTDYMGRTSGKADDLRKTYGREARRIKFELTSASRAMKSAPAQGAKLTTAPAP